MPTWLVGVYPISLTEKEKKELRSFGVEVDDDRPGQPAEVIQWHGSIENQFRRKADRGDKVIRIHRESEDGEPIHVDPPAVITDKRQGEKCMWFILEVEESPESVPWEDFKERCQQVPGLRKVGPTSCRLLTHRQATDLTRSLRPIHG